MNISNSLSLECLQQEFGCVGAFISNEIKRSQIKPIAAPAEFELYYSIYHPMMLLMSRQCLFHQTVGCKKKRFDDKCLRKCDKSASIINLTEASFVVDKQRGDHNALYNPENFLNLDIVAEIQNKFTGFMIDLRDIKTETAVNADKATVVSLFDTYIHGDINARQILEQTIVGTICQQYKKGL
ncbi:U32 family peptidase, partial [Photobacterium carnosum]